MSKYNANDVFIFQSPRGHLLVLIRSLAARRIFQALAFYAGNLAKHSIPHLKKRAADIESVNLDRNRRQLPSSPSDPISFPAVSQVILESPRFCASQDTCPSSVTTNHQLTILVTSAIRPEITKSLLRVTRRPFYTEKNQAPMWVLLELDSGKRQVPIWPPDKANILYGCARALAEALTNLFQSSVAAEYFQPSRSCSSGRRVPHTTSNISPPEGIEKIIFKAQRQDFKIQHKRQRVEAAPLTIPQALVGYLSIRSQSEDVGKHVIQFACHASQAPKFAKNFANVTGHRGQSRTCERSHKITKKPRKMRFFPRTSSHTTATFVTVLRQVPKHNGFDFLVGLGSRPRCSGRKHEFFSVSQYPEPIREWVSRVTEMLQYTEFSSGDIPKMGNDGLVGHPSQCEIAACYGSPSTLEVLGRQSTPLDKTVTADWSVPDINSQVSMGEEFSSVQRENLEPTWIKTIIHPMK
ncbi:hypothetical protein DFH08DRAFT_943918 [Mycena albidolilacea]|uniref:Uncharacterized protein n=1 Tax=Mycena albidolilacea TaxID=1033008 RepID=A0AAD7EBZ2_9AGAR|nr:hypothetical protein DFH08DRAFT_943918 [Mycena albidolilacea]